VRVAQSRSRRCLRGLAVATIACAPVLTLALPAHGEDILGAIDPPATDVPTTTTVPEPAPLEGTPTTPPPTDPATDTTVPEVTTPTTDVTTDTTAPPSDTTTTTTEATTPTTVPEVVVPPVSKPPRGGSNAANGGGTKATGTAATDSKDPQVVLLTVASHDSSFPMPAGGIKVLPALATRSIGGLVNSGATAVQDVFSARFGGDISPVSSDKTWGGLGSAGPRFAPWVVLLAMAWIVRTVIASILADRTAGPRRRRWTLL
jgi:hypothetical protein